MKKKANKFFVIRRKSCIKACIVDGILYISLKKFMPIVISSDDKCRKGIEVDVCDGCECIGCITDTIFINNKKSRKYCDACLSLGKLEELKE